MSNDRWIFTEAGQLDFGSPTFTYQRDDRYREAAGAKWNGRMLRFYDDSLGGKPLTPGKGPIAGAAAGHPLYLLFWGGWWDGAVGSPRRQQIIDQTQILLGSSYFTVLGQYGIARAPLWAKAMTVYDPGPPGVVSYKDAKTALFDMLDALIDDGKIPPKDTRPRPLYIVCVPDTYVGTTKGVQVGWHTGDSVGGLGAGSLWGALVKPDSFTDPKIAIAHTMITLTHELVEMMTDPEPDDDKGWSSGDLEAADAAEGEPPAPNLVRQTACLDGVWVEAYWSNSDGETVIPIEDGYKAWLTAHIAEVVAPPRTITARGKFTPDPSASAACSKDVPACCIKDKEYEWRLYALTETAHVSVNTERFYAPHISWSIDDNGSPIPLTASGSATVHKLQVDGFNKLNPVSTIRDVTLSYVVSPDGRSIDFTAGAGGDFHVKLTCIVRESVNYTGIEPQPLGSTTPDSAITGQIIPGTIPTVTIDMLLDFKGADLVLDDDYWAQIERCMTALARRALEGAEQLPSKTIHKGDPIDQIGEIVRAGLPAHVRPSEFGRIQAADRAARAAAAVLDPAAHRRYVAFLVSSIPALARRRRDKAGRLHP